MQAFPFLNEVAAWKSRTPPAGVALLTTVGSLPQPGRCDFGNGLVLRKASSEEALAFRRAIESLYPLCFRNPYEVVLNAADTSGSRDHLALSEADWRYHVVDYQNSNRSSQDLVAASCLATHELEVRFEVLCMGENCAFSSHPALRRLVEPGSVEDRFMTLDETALAELREIAATLTHFDSPRIQLKEALSQYLSLRDLPLHLPLRYLGYFAIIESLITHEPKPSDPYESITRQVYKKFAVLQRRSARPISYKQFFKDSAPETAWKKLYDYRSRIAHGSRPDFAREHQVLGSAENAIEFLRCATVLVMRQAFEEPDLIADLRAC